MGSASTPPVRHRRDARKRTPFPHARRERALSNFVRVLDGRLGHADGLWVSGGGRGGEVDARGFVWWRRVGALGAADRFGGRRGVVLRRFGVVLVRERVGGELRGGHGFERLPRTDQQSPERTAAKKRTRRGPQHAQHGRFLGGRCLWLFLRGDALGLQPRLECGVVGCRSVARAAFLAFLTRR